jgi:hypothetical protein
LIIAAKEVFAIFRSFTKDKQVSTEYHTGLSYEEFKAGTPSIGYQTQKRVQ